MFNSLLFLLDGIGLSLIIVFGLLAFFGLIVIAIIIVKRKFPSLQIKKEDKKEEELIEEELDRILVPVEDEETARAMNIEAIQEAKKQEAKEAAKKNENEKKE